MNTFGDLALKKEYKSLQSVGDKFAEICSLVDWKSFRIIFGFIYFNKRTFLSRSEAY
jgi:IS5 family transposase